MRQLKYIAIPLICLLQSCSGATESGKPNFSEVSGTWRHVGSITLFNYVIPLSAPDSVLLYVNTKNEVGFGNGEC